MLAFVDQVMYRGKHSGKNSVSYDEFVASGDDGRRL
jgi:hypothetical protein